VELNHVDVYRSGALGTLLDIEGHPVTFMELLEATGSDTGVMNEYIRSIFLLDEAVTLTAVKPFDNSISHNDISLINNKFY
jgi:hypothetical protein